MPNFSLKLPECEDVWRERPEEDQMASSYLLCGSLKEGTLRGMEKADMVVDVDEDEEGELKGRERLLCGAHWREIRPRGGKPGCDLSLEVMGESGIDGVGFDAIRNFWDYDRCRASRNMLPPVLPANVDISASFSKSIHTNISITVSQMDLCA
jgi:hypothetical protein